MGRVGGSKQTDYDSTTMRWGVGGVLEKFDMILIRYGTWNKQNEYVLLR